VEDLDSSGYRSIAAVGITKSSPVVLASDGIYRRADLDFAKWDLRDSRNSIAGATAYGKTAQRTFHDR